MRNSVIEFRVAEIGVQRDAQVCSIMIEIKRSLYMREDTGHKLPHFSDFAAAMHFALMELIALAKV